MMYYEGFTINVANIAASLLKLPYPSSVDGCSMFLQNAVPA